MIEVEGWHTGTFSRGTGLFNIIELAPHNPVPPTLLEVTLNLHRVFSVVIVWFVACIFLGEWISPRGGGIGGFLFAYIVGFALPWLLPKRLQEWMDGNSS